MNDRFYIKHNKKVTAEWDTALCVPARTSKTDLYSSERIVWLCVH